MPDTDSDLCYKSCGDYIVTMKKLPDTITNESRKGIVDPLYASFRANKLLVVSIEHKNVYTWSRINKIQNTSYPNKRIWYEVSKEVYEPDYCRDLNKVSASGIHYFRSRDAAFYWKNYDNGQKMTECAIVDGHSREWHHNGQISKTCDFHDGKLHGPYRSWYNNGQKWHEHTYIHGRIYGPYQVWYGNGHQSIKCTYVNGKLHGLYQSWYDNGQKWEECTYRNGMMHGLCLSWHENGQKEADCTYVNGVRHRSYQAHQLIPKAICLVLVLYVLAKLVYFASE